MLIAKDWKDYELLETGAGEKLERWGEYILRRPDGQVLWPIFVKATTGRPKPDLSAEAFAQADAIYHRSSEGGGNWEFKKQLPKRWTVSYKDLKFFVEPTGFKHTGLFPEQAINWDWMEDLIKNEKLRIKSRKIKVLNLFAYTGAASVACASAGADVTHVDASKGMNTWAKENYDLNADNNYGQVRFITDDVKKFVQREIRRGNKYEGIIMDPPVYGRGPKGELWEIEKEISSLVDLCVQLLSDKPIFFLVNSYTASFSNIALANLFNLLIIPRFKGKVDSGEVGLKIKSSELILPCGIYARWER